MHSTFATLTAPTGISLEPDVPLCQRDLPLDRYDPAFQPYAEEFLSLPSRTPEHVLPWLDRYVMPAREHFGDELLLLAHFYMGGEIVKLVERYGGAVSDSYVLALQARNNPGCSVIVESAVHFMAETLAILAHDHQDVWITNPRAGCTMEMMAKDHMVLPVVDQMIKRWGDDFAVVAYMNTSGRLKAIAGRTGGAVCTSSNAHLVVDAVRRERRHVLFVPDEHLGRNTADRLGMGHVTSLPNATGLTPDWMLEDVPGGVAALDDADMITWGGFCGVHTVFTPDQVTYWHEDGREVHVHPECPREVVRAADGAGSTNYLWKVVTEAPRDARLAIATEGHFVANAIDHARRRGVDIVHMADVPGSTAAGCGCATMSRNDPPHLAGMLDLLRRGEAPERCRVLPGDMVDETTGRCTRLDEQDGRTLQRNACIALERMVRITEESAAS